MSVAAVYAACLPLNTTTNEEKGALRERRRRCRQLAQAIESFLVDTFAAASAYTQSMDGLCR